MYSYIISFFSYCSVLGQSFFPHLSLLFTSLLISYCWGISKWY